ncbi:extracellular solute-binding protein [Gracilibacillus salinarum]|uniref:Extracellular solute-binding protein n=1 Tax=Gracilibacillus salinarum TaxID=2932255 RepID=A0ABY4GR29_9BACI|nr:extracellular solute-binding protein [Gracilibacillus salinarum]UOQ86815.1 extracellular solute-binding protein [Gracilibacillus salinarum]
MKKSILSGFCMLFLIFLSACSNNEPSSADSTNENDSKTTEKNEISITFRTGGGTNQGLVNWLNDTVIPKFNEEHPNVTVNLVPLEVSEGDYFAKVSLLLQSEDSAPDIVTEDTFMVNSDASAGYLEPLDDRIEAWDGWGEITDTVKKGVTAEDGSIYGVPYNTDTRGLWYNKELLKEAGITIPWKPKNWEDILNAATAVKETFGNEVVPLWMNSGKATGEATSMQTFEMLLYGTDDPLYDFDEEKWIVKSDGLLSAFQFIDNVYQNELGPNLSQVLNGQGSSIAYQELMPNNQLAIGLDGMWQTGNWHENGPALWAEFEETLGYAAMPTENGQEPGSTSMSGGWALSIPAKSDNKDMAWEFIKMASTPEMNLDLQLNDRNITPFQSASEDPAYQELPFFEEATSFVETTNFRPAVDKYPNVSTVIQTLVEQVVTDAITPEQAVEQYQKQVTDIVGGDKTIER